MSLRTARRKIIPSVIELGDHHLCLKLGKAIILIQPIRRTKLNVESRKQRLVQGAYIERRDQEIQL